MTEEPLKVDRDFTGVKSVYPGYLFDLKLS